jgi:hypothetical protein
MMLVSTYPKPAHFSPYQPIHPRRLLPLSRAPLPNVLPTLPSPSREPIFHGYRLTTHIIPAAYPRTAPDVPLPNPLIDSSDKKERRAWAEKTLAAFKTKNDELMKENKVQNSRKLLWCCANLYVKKDHPKPNKRRVTLLLAHANGFPKEVRGIVPCALLLNDNSFWVYKIWEPTLAHLLSTSHDVIDEIWSFESIQHGDSALLNAQQLPGICSSCPLHVNFDLFIDVSSGDWADNARDVLNFVLHYLPSQPVSSTTRPPTHLPIIPHAETETREARGFSDRTLVGIGHSFGGCAL